MKRLLKILLLCIFACALVTGCSKKQKEAERDTQSRDIQIGGTQGQDQNGSKVDWSDADLLDTSKDSEVATDFSHFDYSQVFDENGFIKGVKAAELLPNLFDYTKFVIPEDAVQVSDEEVQEQIQAICVYYDVYTEITDREVKDGDRVNIDYVGSIDGVEFEGGSTDGAGTIVTAGSNEYIDDFLTQIIGHKPGETIDVIVTFPEDYGNEELNGKEAKFVTTINYILGEGKLTDDDVKKYLSFANGWSTVAEAEKGIRENLRSGKIRNYIADYIIQYAEKEVDKDKLPQEYKDYYDKVTVAYFLDAAYQANLSLNDYLSIFVQVDDRKALIEKFKDSNAAESVKAVVMQAIAEKENITVTEEDIRDYVEDTESEWESALVQYKSQYGLAYMKHIVLQKKVMEFLNNHVVLEK